MIVRMCADVQPAAAAGVFLNHSLVFFFDTGPPSGPGEPWLGEAAWQVTLMDSVSPTTTNTITATVPLPSSLFPMGAGALNAASHPCTPSTVPTELSPRLQQQNLQVCFWTSTFLFPAHFPLLEQKYVGTLSLPP